MRFPAFCGVFWHGCWAHQARFHWVCEKTLIWLQRRDDLWARDVCRVFFFSFLFGGVSCLKRAFRARFCRRRGQSETCVSQEVTRLGIVSVARHTCPKVTTNDRKSVSALATPNPSSPDFSQPVMWFQRQTFEQGPGHQRTDQKGRRPKCKH